MEKTKYIGQILICDKEIFEDVKRVMPEESTLTEIMYTKLFPAEYEIPKRELLKNLVFTKTDIFNEFFNDYDYSPMDSGEAFRLDNKSYHEFVRWLEGKLDYTTLMEIAEDEDFVYAETLVKTYNKLKDLSIDFDEEVVMFHHVF